MGLRFLNGRFCIVSEIYCLVEKDGTITDLKDRKKQDKQK